MSFSTEKCRLTPEGGLAILEVADEAIAVGEVVAIIQGGTSNRVKKCPASGNENEMPIGVAYTAAANAGNSIWIVVSGHANVLPESGITAAQGNVMLTSTSQAGRVIQSTTGGSTAQHWREVGHFCANGSGNGVATEAIVHFN